MFLLLNYLASQSLAFKRNWHLITAIPETCRALLNIYTFIITGTIHVSVDYYGSSIASPQCLDTYVTTAQKMDQDEEKSDFEFLPFLVLYYIVVYQ